MLESAPNQPGVTDRLPSQARERDFSLSTRSFLDLALPQILRSPLLLLLGAVSTFRFDAQPLDACHRLLEGFGSSFVQWSAETEG